MKNKIGVAGYLYGDFYPKPAINLDSFRRIYGNGDNVLFIDAGILPQDGKVNITEGRGSSDDFNRFLKEYTERILPGGGGRNSAAVLESLGSDVTYFDTSSTPEFDIGLRGPVYYHGGAQPCRSLVLKSETGTLNIRSPREDKTTRLKSEFKSKLIDFLREGNDFLANSISNGDLALTLAKEAQGGLYAVITDQMPFENWRLDRLLQRANSLFFSYKDFCSFARTSSNIKLAGDYSGNKTSKLLREIEEVAKERELASPLFVTLGAGGAIAYDPTPNREGKFRVYLKREELRRLTRHRTKKGISTNKSGDTFAAKVISNVRGGMNMLEATKDATRYVIEKLYKFKVNPSKIAVEMFEKPSEREETEPEILGDVGALESSLYDETDVLK